MIAVIHVYAAEGLAETNSIIASLSTIVLNSRDWLEIVWLLEILRFRNQPYNRLYPKKPTGMHWLCYNDAVSWSENSNISAYSQF